MSPSSQMLLRLFLKVLLSWSRPGHVVGHANGVGFRENRDQSLSQSGPRLPVRLRLAGPSWADDLSPLCGACGNTWRVMGGGGGGPGPEKGCRLLAHICTDILGFLTFEENIRKTILSRDIIQISVLEFASYLSALFGFLFYPKNPKFIFFLFLKVKYPEICGNRNVRTTGLDTLDSEGRVGVRLMKGSDRDPRWKRGH